MEFFLKLLAVIGPIFVPILVAFINIKSSIKKHPKDEFSDDVNSSEKFVSIINSDCSMLIKDRITQQTFMSKKITFREAIYFYNFEDMEYWIKYFINNRKYIKILRNSKGNITHLFQDSTKIERVGYLVGYVIFAFLAISPLLNFNFYHNLYQESIKTNNYLITFNLIIWPILLFVIAAGFLIRGSQVNDAKRFIKNFKENAVKISN